MSEETPPFQMAVGKQIVRSFYAMQGGGMASSTEGLTPNAGDLQLAFDVLDMPEMQAIRKQLKFMLDALESGCNDDVNHGQRYDWLGEYLPDHVRGWVLS